MNEEKASQEKLRQLLLEQLAAAEKLHCITGLPSVQEECADLEERIRDRAFRVVVVGTVSSGKSTFLNALLGKDLLVHGTQETTATITELINTKPDDPRSGSCVVHFKNGEVYTLPDTAQLAEYSAIRYKSDPEKQAVDVSREISRIELFPYYAKTEEPVVFYDTPGLNGMTDFLREKTIEQIRSAHACIYLLPVRGLSQYDVDFIREISVYQKDFLFVQNFADRLVEEEEGTNPEEKLAEQERILREQVFAESSDARYRICAVSSRNALIGQDPSFRKLYDTDLVELTEQRRKEVYRESNFPRVLEEIQRLVDENQRGWRQLLVAAETLCVTLERIYEFLWKQQSDTQENAGKGEQSAQELEKIEAHLEKNDALNRKNLRNMLNVEMLVLQSDQKKQIGEAIEQIKQYVEQEIEEQTTLEELETYFEQNLAQKTLLEQAEMHKKELCASMQENMDALYNLAASRIMQYTGWAQIQEQHARDFTIDESMQPFEPPKDDIVERQRAMLEEAEKQLEQSKKELRTARQMKQGQENKVVTLTQQMDNVKKAYQAQDSALGREPKAETRQRWEEVERSGFFGRLVDAVAGKQKRLVSVPDTEKQDQWRKQKASIHNEYIQENDRINRELQKHRAAIKTCEQDIHISEGECRENSKKVQDLKKLLKQAIAVLEDEKKKATQEYIRKQKKMLRADVEEYLSGAENSLLECWKDAFAAAAEENKQKILTQTLEMYQTAFENRKQELHRLLKQQAEYGTEQFEEIQKLKQIVETLQEAKTYGNAK